MKTADEIKEFILTLIKQTDKNLDPVHIAEQDLGNKILEFIDS